MTIPLESLRAVQTIITHANCPDGMASAAILSDALPNRTIVFANPGDAIEPCEHALFCDFSPPRERAAEWRDRGAIVLDHHKYQRDVVESFPMHVFADEATEPGVSGAMLAYRHVWCRLIDYYNESVERFAELAGIRDTWQRDHEDWNLACYQASALRFYPPHFWIRNELASLDMDSVYNVGMYAHQKHLARVADVLAGAYHARTAHDREVVIFQGIDTTSDAAEDLGSDVYVVAGFLYSVKGGAVQLTYSVRSHSTFDCGAFAKHNGGGGHTRAAGFSTIIGSAASGLTAGLADPYSVFMALVHEF